MTSVCPNGFVIPDHPDRSGVWYPNRTYSNCAFRCYRFIEYSESEWARIESASRLFLTIGLILILITVVVQLMAMLFKITRSYHYFILTLILLSLLQTVGEIATRSQHINQTWCHDNAVLLDASDGLTACSAEGFLLMFCKFSMLLCCMVQALTTLGMVLGRTGYNFHKTRQMMLILGVPLLACLIMAIIGMFGAFWFGGAQCLCNTRYSLVAFLPIVAIIVVFLTITVVSMVAVMVQFCLLLHRTKKAGHSVRPSISFIVTNEDRSLYSDEIVRSDIEMLPSELDGTALVTLDDNKIRNTPVYSQLPESMDNSQRISRTPGSPNGSVSNAYRINTSPAGGNSNHNTSVNNSNNDENPDAQLWDVFVMLKTPFLFTVSFIILQSFSIVYFLLAATFQLKNRTKEYDDWGSCVLHHYRGIDQSWEPFCGNNPPRISMRFRMWAVLVTYGQSIFVSIIAAPSSISFIQIIYQAYKRRMR